MNVLAPARCGQAAQVERGQQCDRDGDDRCCGGLQTDGDTGDDVGCRAGLGGLGDLPDRAVFTSSVVLGDVDDDYAQDDTDHSASEEVSPSSAQQGICRIGEQCRCDDACDVVSAVEGLHRLLVLVLQLDGQDTDDTGEQTERTDDKREHESSQCCR